MAPQLQSVLDTSSSSSNNTSVGTTKQEPSLKRGRWLVNKLSSLYDDPVFKNATPEVKHFYRNQAYDKWVLPYYTHINKSLPANSKLTPQTREAFLSGTGVDKKQFEQLQREEAARRQGEKGQAALVGRTDKSIAGISSLFKSLLEPLGPSKAYLHKPTQQELDNPQSRPFVQKLKYSEEFYDKQVQDQEDIIQELGGHTVGTRINQLVAETALFEATGAAKGAKVLKIANPKTMEYTDRLLRSMWNGAVTGLFWGSSTGTKPKQLHEDTETFALFGILGATGTKFTQFLRTFTKVAPPEVVNNTVEKASIGLLKGKVLIPSKEEFTKLTVSPEVNNKAAIAGVSRIINIMSWQLKHSQAEGILTKSFEKVEQTGLPIIDDKITNGAFKELTPQQQKLVITRLLSVLHNSQDVTQHELAKEFAEQFVKEQEESATKVAPVVQEVQQKINQFIEKTVPGSNTTQLKIGAVSPRHNTSIRSPLGHVAARISWLHKQASNDLLSSTDRLNARMALEEEEKLYKRVKEIQAPGHIVRYIRNAGGEVVGRQPESDLILFNDPVTKSTLAMHEKDMVDSVAVKEYMKKSRDVFEKGKVSNIIRNFVEGRK